MATRRALLVLIDALLDEIKELSCVVFLPLFKLEAQFGPIANNQNINAYLCPINKLVIHLPKGGEANLCGINNPVWQAELGQVFYRAH
jgi:hypothetical protein